MVFASVLSFLGTGRLVMMEDMNQSNFHRRYNISYINLFTYSIWIIKWENIESQKLKLVFLASLSHAGPMLLTNNDSKINCSHLIELGYSIISFRVC